MFTYTKFDFLKFHVSENNNDDWVNIGWYSFHSETFDFDTIWIGQTTETYRYVTILLYPQYPTAGMAIDCLIATY
jgi:hypothetical protein